MDDYEADSNHHVPGLWSIRKAVTDCGGTLELCCGEALGRYEFAAEVILPVSAAAPAAEQVQ